MLWNHRLNSRYSFYAPIFNERPLGLVRYRTRTVLSFPVARNKAAREVFFRFVSIFRGEVTIEAYLVRYLDVIDRVAYNFTHDVFVLCIDIFCVGYVVRSLSRGGCSCSVFCWTIDTLSILTVSLIPSFSTVKVFGLSATTTNGPDVFVLTNVTDCRPAYEVCPLAN